MKDKHLFTEGDINLSDERMKWQNQISDPETLAYLEKDSKYSLHQSLSTPCIDVISSSKGLPV